MQQPTLTLSSLPFGSTSDLDMLKQKLKAIKVTNKRKVEDAKSSADKSIDHFEDKSKLKEAKKEVKREEDVMENNDEAISKKKSKKNKKSSKE